MVHEHGSTRLYAFAHVTVLGEVVRFCLLLEHDCIAGSDNILFQALYFVGFPILLFMV
jgi:hypothetical protein